VRMLRWIGMMGSRRRGGFAPSSLPWLLYYQVGTSLAYQDDELTTPATADGDRVGGLQDLSAPAIPTLQYTLDANRPTLKTNILNGRPVVRVATSHGLATRDDTIVPVTSGYLAVIVNRTGGAADTMGVSARRSDSGVPIFVLRATDGTAAKGYDGTRLRNDANVLVDLASDQAAGWQLIEVTWDGATVTRYRGGVSRATAALAGTISLNRFSLGVDIHDLGYVTGDIALYGFMTSVPSAGQLADFRAWVTSYYGIAMG
jgi:hypothetical protein